MARTPNIRVHENLLGPSQYTYTKERLVPEAQQWFYSPFTATPDDLDTLDEYSGSFSHLIGADDKGLSNLWEPALQVLFAACDRNGETPVSVLRIRLGLATRTPYEIIHSPHVDHPVLKHRTGIWYPYTSTGPTRVYTETRRQPVPKTPTLMFEQQPTANLWFDFDGAQYHASSTPTLHETRMVMTINYVTQDM
jgi:hypothetical protein